MEGLAALQQKDFQCTTKQFNQAYSKACEKRKNKRKEKKGKEKIGKEKRKKTLSRGI